MMKTCLLLAVLALLLVVVPRASSFDCTKAATEVEKMICADTELSKLDEEMGKLYTEALKKSSDSVGFKEAQRLWLKERNICIDNGCLRMKCQQHLASLTKNSPVYSTIYPPDVSEFKVDCKAAKSLAEKLICKQAGSSDEQEWLADVDRYMRLGLQWALMRSKDKLQLLESQRRWMEEMRDTCKNIFMCVDTYGERNTELAAMSERPESCYILKPLADGKGHALVNEQGKLPPIEPVCQIMEENLNHFCDQPPMVCGLKVDPRFQQQITFPGWIPLDPEANIALIEEFIRAPWEHFIDKETPKKKWQEAHPEVEAALAIKRLTFSKAKLDLYNLGKAQLAYRLDYGTCMVNNPQLAAGPIQWWAEPVGSSGIHVQQAPEVIRSIFHEYEPLDSGPAGETFLYSGQIYTYWMVGGEGKKSLYVNRYERWINPEGNETTEVAPLV